MREPRDGRDGIDGLNGIDGQDGAEGKQGPAGEQGPRGPQGPEGPKGDPGIQGEPGPQGEKGEEGQEGPVGPQGKPGLRGIDGRDGHDGQPGPQGPAGPQGPRGKEGEKGDKPAHRWIDETKLQFENPDGTWGKAVELRGPKGPAGRAGANIGGGGGGGIDLGIPEAPIDGTTYGRKDAGWVPIFSGGSATWGNIVGNLSDQGDLQDALDLKANEADLADVATSGDYFDLSNRPDIPPIAFSFGDATPDGIWTAPHDGTITYARLAIDTAFNGTSPSVALGITGSLSALLAANESTVAEVGQFEVAPDVHINSGEEVIISITAGSGASQGAGRVVLTFVPD